MAAARHGRGAAAGRIPRAARNRAAAAGRVPRARRADGGGHRLQSRHVAAAVAAAGDAAGLHAFPPDAGGSAARRHRATPRARWACTTAACCASACAPTSCAGTCGIRPSCATGWAAGWRRPSTPGAGSAYVHLRHRRCQSTIYFGDSMPRPRSSSPSACCSVVYRHTRPTRRTRAQRLAQDAVIVDTHIDAPWRTARSLGRSRRRHARPGIRLPACARRRPRRRLHVDLHLGRRGRRGQRPGRSRTRRSMRSKRWSDAIRTSSRCCARRTISSVCAARRQRAAGAGHGERCADRRRPRQSGEIPCARRALHHPRPQRATTASAIRPTRCRTKWHGLSPFGEQVVRGNEPPRHHGRRLASVRRRDRATRWRSADVPVIASHSALRHFTPGFERNLSDETASRPSRPRAAWCRCRSAPSSSIRRRRMTYAGYFCAHAKRSDRSNAAASPRASRQARTIREGLEVPRTRCRRTIDAVLDQIDHAVSWSASTTSASARTSTASNGELAGGTAFGRRLPEPRRGAAAARLQRADIRKILGGNLLRVWQQVEIEPRKR